MPGLMIFFGLINMTWVALALSSVGRKLAIGIPLSFLVLFQGFRLPLELILHGWAKQGIIPNTMTWTGSNFDIVIGALALGLAPFVGSAKILAWIFNAVGLVLLLNVMRVAVMSSPLPFAWQVNPPLQLAFHLPYALIIPVCIGGALFGHIVLTRALFLKKV